MLSKYVSQVNFNSYDEFIKSFEVRVPDNFNFAYDVVDEIARTTPDKVAIVWCNDKGEEAVFTFGQLKYYSDKAANFFKSVGIKKGDPVMLILKRRYEFWFCILALHKLGAVCIPATHLLTAKDIVYRNNAADIKMIVTVNEEDVIKHVEDAQKESPTLKFKALVGGSREGWYDFNSELEKADENFVRPTGEEATKNSDTSLIYFTSGTTGMPKMVQHDFTYPLGHILTAKYWQNVQEDGLHLTVADTGWAKAVWGKIYGQWTAGSAVFVYDYDKFVPKELLEVIVKYGVTTFCAPPTIYRFFIKEDLTKYDFSKLKYCVVAGEPLNPEVYNQFYKATGLKLMEGYGQTECTVALATYSWMDPKPGSMGKPSPGYDIDIVDENGNSCDVGEEGQIVIRTDKRIPPGMFNGYYRDEELTKKVWNNGIYYTGDMAWRDEDGYFWFVGRADDVIKSSGYRIGPFEVESALLEHPAVLECAITAVPDPIRGQIVKATVVLAKGYTAGDDLAKELQEHVKTVTAPYKYPRIIEFVDELPKTISGKIRRVEIREQDSK
ncbi:MAG TPA: acetyl-CoA synthetase [Ruminiclostridium sp.]|jgi:acetyl-CoA synthetase|uniref:Acetyl-CoA synthetase n=1 Tax=Acetivibrio saccincola TaxID=1677857 RepID=A0A2K9E625_9FIRM|nr:AMP-binding protein [Acetivibrio saccincola]HAA43038.1 acetyl-CoA synthetase [Ruminiclostridium sp.]AUG56916.1 Acetyl-coenzyme A synthetase [Acetivibrio saccincola]NLW27741.1 AMP-binding protein [Acetivibrio saccincola]PQQ66944.1 acetyl-CoA synthetase [Acetivibrio saccincola]HQD28685.1 AMP-binding protein [Acetivibrio saccincola]